jgi:hypothetical protein
MKNHDLHGTLIVPGGRGGNYPCFSQNDRQGIEAPAQVLTWVADGSGFGMPRGRRNFTIGLFIGVALMLFYESWGHKTPEMARMPAPELAFLSAALDARQVWVGAPNDLARANMRAARANSLCQALPGLAASGWLGTVRRIDPDSFPDYAGKKTVRIVIELAPHVAVTTPAAPLLNMPDTMVEAGTAIYAVAATVPIGGGVKFSGRFFADGTDCMAETSLTRDGSMTNPVFKFQLTALAKN